MLYIPVILGSTRRGRQSVKVAKYVVRELAATGRAEIELLDLQEYNFPIMEERLRMRDDPPARVQEFSDKLNRADAIVIVTPEYNNGYPGVLKNALDYFYPEYRRKPFGIVTVSAGGFGGLNCLMLLRQVIFGLGAFSIPSSLPISKVQTSFDEDGNLLDQSYTKRTAAFFDEVLWFAEAIKSQRERTT